MAFTTGSCPFGAFDSDPQFQVDADRIVDYTRRKLGDPVMLVHLSSSQIYASFEEACFDFSSMINSYQAKSALSQFLGGPTGSLSGSEQTYPSRLIEFQKKMAEPYGEEAGVGGSHPLLSGSIDLQIGQQKYDLQALLNVTGSDGGQLRIFPKTIYHYSPLAAYRFFGTTSAINYLHNQFSFESFTPETIFYLLPIWEDILRGMQFKTSNKVRRSNYSYGIHDDVLTLYPPPTQNMKLWLEYALLPDPTKPTDAAESRTFHGVANLANVPFGNITYSNVNSIGKSWIRRMAFALAKETEGQIRSKFSTVPIPNGDLTLNGAELINDARAEMDALRNELKEILEETTYDKLAAREAEMALSVSEALKNVPLGIYIG
jgi:hypothetical protein